jgi:DNA-directed RNA polymerase beta' subunit
VGCLQTYEYSLPPVKKEKIIALKASKKKARVSSEEDSDNEEDAVAMLAKNFRRLMKNDKFKKKFTKRLKKAHREFEPEEAKRMTQEVPDILNAQALGIFGLTMGISSRVKRRPTMRLSVMSQKNKKKLLAFVAPGLHVEPQRSEISSLCGST